MPLYIIKGDITKLNCDAIVNVANNTLLGGGGVDGAIHKAAGKELLKECITLGGCLTGEAKITKGYNLSSKYIIHTVGPIWNGGFYNEREKLESCYKNSLILANEYNCQSIAFPVISSGAYKYPFDEALLIGINAIKEFLINSDMIVYIVIYDKSSYSIDKNNYSDLLEFIEENYIDNNELLFESTLLNCSYNCNSSLIEMISNLDDNFSVTLLKLIDLKNMSDVECYKKANVSKQTWYKIMNDKNYKPSKNTILCFAIALELSLEETNHLLQTVGFTLSKSNKFDVIIEYFLINEEYDIYIINETLFKFDQECLGL